MKKTSIITISVLAMTLCASCDNLLNLESETSVTTNYLKTDKDGLKRAIAGLYVYERDNIVDNSDSKGIVILPQLFDFNTDIFLFNAGNWASLGRLTDLTPDSGVIEDYWKFWYAIAGRANEIIASSEHLGLEDPEIRKIHGEACLSGQGPTSNSGNDSKGSTSTQSLQTCPIWREPTSLPPRMKCSLF